MRATLHRPGRRPAGFTYVGLLIFIAILGTTAAMTLQVGALLQRRVAEDELLAIGIEYRQALISYANATPAGQDPLPRSLDELLRDPRYPGVRRHLRRVYIDPLTGGRSWGLVRAPNGGGIAGIHSLSDAPPIKTAHFAPPFEAFEGQARYRDWVFAGIAGVAPVRP